MILYTPYCNLIKTPFAYPILIAPSMQINESFPALPKKNLNISLQIVKCYFLFTSAFPLKLPALVSGKVIHRRYEKPTQFAIYFPLVHNLGYTLLQSKVSQCCPLRSLFNYNSIIQLLLC